MDDSVKVNPLIVRDNASANEVKKYLEENPGVGMQDAKAAIEEYKQRAEQQEQYKLMYKEKLEAAAQRNAELEAEAFQYKKLLLKIVKEQTYDDFVAAVGAARKIMESK